jgi:hypothetical protein
MCQQRRNDHDIDVQAGQESQPHYRVLAGSGANDRTPLAMIRT